MAHEATHVEGEELERDAQVTDVLNFEKALARILARLLGERDSSNNNEDHESDFE